MISKIKVSFIVPIYNIETYIERCIRSILDQTLTDIEVICINDYSTDKSLDIVKMIARDDGRVKIFQNRRNRGLSYSRNKGLTKAKGEYVWLVDSDDWIIDTHAAEILYLRAKETNLPVIMFDLEDIYEKDTLRNKLGHFGRKKPHKYTEECSGIDMFTCQMNEGDFMSMVQLYFYNRSWIIEKHIKFQNDLLFEDVLFSFDIMLNVDRVGYLPKRFYGYFRRDNSITTSRDNASRKVASCAYIIGEIYSKLDKLPVGEDVVDAVTKYTLVLKSSLIDNFFLTLQNDCIIPYFRHTDQYITRFLIAEEYPLVWGKITRRFLLTVNDAQKVIVYGAGYVSEITSRILEKMNVKDYYIAVTKSNDQSVHEISEFKGEEALVLIAVTREKQKEMIEYALSLGLNNYICMV